MASRAAAVLALLAALCFASASADGLGFRALSEAVAGALHVEFVQARGRLRARTEPDGSVPGDLPERLPYGRYFLGPQHGAQAYTDLAREVKSPIYSKPPPPEPMHTPSASPEVEKTRSELEMHRTKAAAQALQAQKEHSQIVQQIATGKLDPMTPLTSPKAQKEMVPPDEENPKPVLKPKPVQGNIPKIAKQKALLAAIKSLQEKRRISENKAAQRRAAQKASRQQLEDERNKKKLAEARDKEHVQKMKQQVNEHADKNYARQQYEAKRSPNDRARTEHNAFVMSDTMEKQIADAVQKVDPSVAKLKDPVAALTQQLAGP